MSGKNRFDSAFEDSKNKSGSLKKNYKASFLLGIISVFFAVYALKLFSLQILEGAQYQNRSVRISRTITKIAAQRGEIFDRKAKLPMVINTDSFAVDLIPGEIPQGYFDTVATKLAKFLGISKMNIDTKIFSKIAKSAIKRKKISGCPKAARYVVAETISRN